MSLGTPYDGERRRRDEIGSREDAFRRSGFIRLLSSRGPCVGRRWEAAPYH